jgi:hypothetical protein
MVEKNFKQENLDSTDKVAQFLQNGGTVKHTINVFEVSSDIETENKCEGNHQEVRTW